MCRTQVHTDTIAPKYNQDAVLNAFFQCLHMQVRTSNTKKCLHDLCMFRTQTVLKRCQTGIQPVSLRQFIEHCGREHQNVKPMACCTCIPGNQGNIASGSNAENSNCSLLS